MRALLLVLPLSIALAACSHDHGDTVGREPDEYLGCATDELWPLFDAHEEHALMLADGANAPHLSAPNVTAALPAIAPRFVWSKKNSEATVPDGDVATTCEQFSRGAITTQHLEPITGTVYQLRLFDGDKVDYRVLTTLEQWQPPASLWQRLRGKSRRIEIIRMPVADNDLVSGPYVDTTPVTFMVLAE